MHSAPWLGNTGLLLILILMNLKCLLSGREREEFSQRLEASAAQADELQTAHTALQLHAETLSSSLQVRSCAGPLTWCVKGADHCTSLGGVTLV